MIVDDNAKMRKMIRMFIFRDNDIVVECADGSEAVSTFREFHPDLVFMDIEMNKMDGFSATEKIYEQDPTAKVVFVTGQNTLAYRKKASSMNASGFILKENLSELENIILRFSTEH